MPMMAPTAHQVRGPGQAHLPEDRGEGGVRVDLGVGHHAHQGQGRRQVDEAAQAERADDAEGDIALRVTGLLGGDGHHVEAQEGEKHQGGGLDDAAGAIGHQGQSSCGA